MFNLFRARKEKPNYTEFHIEELNQFCTLIQHMNETNLKEITYKLENKYYSVNWDLKSYIQYANIGHVPNLKFWLENDKKSFLSLLFLGEEYAERGWEIKYNPRNYREFKRGDDDAQIFFNEAERNLLGALQVNMDVVSAYKKLMIVYMGLENDKLMWWAYERARETDPEDIWTVRLMMWCLSPEWNSTNTTTLEARFDFMQKELKTFTSPCRHYLWFYFLENCAREMGEGEYKKYVCSKEVRDRTESIIADFDLDLQTPYFNVYYANKVLATCFAIEMSSKKLKPFAELALPNNICMVVWTDYFDTYKEVAKAIQALMKS